ncbi:hypothetical protein HMPREF1548_05508 [Clostridium sp. KLE 1755]|nr:hypothetical protein HMPREF1548_05508 [Clostridium sp. KLE 1755]
MHKGQISVKKNEKCTVPIWRMDRVQILLRKYEKLPLAYL